MVVQALIRILTQKYHDQNCTVLLCMILKYISAISATFTIFSMNVELKIILPSGLPVKLKQPLLVLFFPAQFERIKYLNIYVI